MLLASCTLASCDKEKEEPANIEVTNGSMKQEVFADNTQGQGEIKFSTAGAWTSTITPTTKADASTWVEIDPASGDKAGEYSINIKLETNYTGETRKAEIKISCSGTIITISVEQKGTTKDGKIPEPEPEVEQSGAGTLTNETAKRSLNLLGATHEILRDNVVRIVFMGEEKMVDGKVAKFDSWADFVNPLQNGRLQSGTYNIRNINNFSYDEFKAGECGWWKTSLGSYGQLGTIKVELKGNIYTFTIDILLETGYEDQYETVKGSFTGVPRYLNEEIKVESITLSESQKTLELGSEFALVATILPENATNKNYTWSSSNTAVATVSENGLVHGVSAGTATITATTADGNKTAACVITVNPAVAVQSIQVDPTTLSMLKGENYTGPITVTVAPENAFNKSYTWVSSKPEVAEYDGKTIRAKAAGETTITFTTAEGAKTATLKITVSERESSGNGTVTIVDKGGKYEDKILTLIGIEHTVLSKNSVKLTLLDSDGDRRIEIDLCNPLSNGRLAAGSYTCVYPASSANNTFSSQYLGQYGYYNKGNITVAINGDNYTITLNNIETTNSYTFNGSYTGKLTYTNQYIDVASVSLNKSTLTLTFGEDYLNLRATVLPDNAFNKNVSWSSSDPDIIYVNHESGELKPGSKTGTATVTVTTEDGAKTATCVVTVNPIPSTGNGTFSNNNGQSVNIKRALQWVNEKDPKNIDLTFLKENSTSEAVRLTLTRGSSDTGALKAGTYKTIYYLTADELGIKYSYSITGTVTVTVNGDQYTVALDITSEGVKITGNYSGGIIK